MPSPITYVSRNGELVPAAEARISVFNPAIYGAWGVYESLQLANGVMFEPLAHLRRLAHSAEVIGLPLPADLRTIRTWMQVVARQYEQPDATLRLFVLGPDNGGDPVAYIWAQPPNRFTPAFYTSGATAITFEARSFPARSQVAQRACQLHGPARGAQRRGPRGAPVSHRQPDGGVEQQPVRGDRRPGADAAARRGAVGGRPGIS